MTNGKNSRIEILEVVSSEQCCFRALTSSSADLESMKNSALFQGKPALNQRCSALIFLALKHWFFRSSETLGFGADLL